VAPRLGRELDFELDKRSASPWQRHSTWPPLSAALQRLWEGKGEGRDEEEGVCAAR